MFTTTERIICVPPDIVPDREISPQLGPSDGRACNGLLLEMTMGPWVVVGDYA